MNLGPRVILASVIVSSVLMGCASPRSFLGASLPKMKYEDVKKRETPLRLQLIVEFQRNGDPFPKGDIPLRDYAAKILGDTGVITPIDAVSAADDQGEGAIRIVLNNIADSGTVAAEASRSGFPLWMVGKTITDAYTMSMAITIKGKTIRRTGIKHAFHTALGNMEIPEGIEVFPSNEAFGRMLEQMILRGLQDMQRSGELSWLGSPGSIVFS
ncbi:hypothetical protein [Nitrosospira sp. Nsp13]|uniref:hypothetical protein n=1 Tax=Nitrosospira sp. Nsp13 TaxID=1855332 RepID=UPI00088F031B|nr:hypothetical protein [Nitrosospira sp. Nsp13]SCX84239.1 hypothetical protein SAMN05216308_101515 [Nitrosospira sp. Nsp13]